MKSKDTGFRLRRNDRQKQRLDSSVRWNDEKEQSKNWMTSLRLLKTPPAQE